ncbi:hypothetical protein GMRT_10941 [Giardia muris]|uniref:Coiled-coil protein n=1 Tax=Giardia muris TaxID=5742 RepID=A0A4Z1T458_GIAMU|nr:hypothetical protein GMRT_10941 [Giardia muris]|eukprot:TNJ30438.1 hypothetical protein GMRT_10941 [Giardia muris]
MHPNDPPSFPHGISELSSILVENPTLAGDFPWIHDPTYDAIVGQILGVLANIARTINPTAPITAEQMLHSLDFILSQNAVLRQQTQGVVQDVTSLNTIDELKRQIALYEQTIHQQRENLLMLESNVSHAYARVEALTKENAHLRRERDSLFGSYRDLQIEVELLRNRLPNPTLSNVQHIETPKRPLKLAKLYSVQLGTAEEPTTAASKAGASRSKRHIDVTYTPDDELLASHLRESSDKGRDSQRELLQLNEALEAELAAMKKDLESARTRSQAARAEADADRAVLLEQIQALTAENGNIRETAKLTEDKLIEILVEHRMAEAPVTIMAETQTPCVETASKGISALRCHDDVGTQTLLVLATVTVSSSEESIISNLESALASTNTAIEQHINTSLADQNTIRGLQQEVTELKDKLSECTDNLEVRDENVKTLVQRLAYFRDLLYKFRDQLHEDLDVDGSPTQTMTIDHPSKPADAILLSTSTVHVLAEESDTPDPILDSLNQLAVANSQAMFQQKEGNLRRVDALLGSFEAQFRALLPEAKPEGEKTRHKHRRRRHER